MSNEARTSREIEGREKQPVRREGTRPGLVFRPDVDVVERGDEFFVVADLPGVDDRHVQVKLEEGVLSIDADLAAQPEESWTPVYAEYRLGGYHREFTLSDSIDAERIHAAMRDGVLEIHLPKTDEHRVRAIPVQAG